MDPLVLISPFVVLALVGIISFLLSRKKPITLTEAVIAVQAGGFTLQSQSHADHQRGNIWLKNSQAQIVYVAYDHFETITVSLIKRRGEVAASYLNGRALAYHCNELNIQDPARSNDLALPLRSLLTETRSVVSVATLEATRPAKKE